MKINAHSFVFKGLSPEPYLAAAANSQSVWAVASGNLSGAAMTLIHSIEEAAKGFSPLDKKDLETVFNQINPAMQHLNVEVSAAGVYTNDKELFLFNIGNARALVFSNGYLSMHTDDQTEAYEEFQNAEDGTITAYERLRFQQKRLILRNALGSKGNGNPQFYAPIPLQNNISILICTEQFWRYISVIEMELDFRKTEDPKEWLKIMSRRVLMKSNHELDNENFAAVTIMIEK